MQRFIDKVVIVTGAGSGIGEATARRFSDEGAAVVLAGDHLPQLERVAADLPPERTLVKRCDVAKYKQVEALVAAAIKLGLERRDVPACLTLFAPVVVRADGSLGWEAARRHPGQYVDLRAELDLWVVLSNCPHPLDPTPPSALGPVHAIRFVAPPAAADDPCRNAGPEAKRAFAATERYLR